MTPRGRKRRPDAAPPRPSLLMLHPSDEMYGADKVLLESVDALALDFDIEVWLADDVAYERRQLSLALESRKIRVRRMALPVLRRAYAKPQHMPTLARQLAKTGRQIRDVRPDVLYINTGALAPATLVGRLLRIPVVLHLHEYLEGSQRLAVLPFAHFASRVLIVSDAIRAPFHASLRRRAVRLYNGFDLPAPAAQDVSETIEFVLASRWNTWKGYDAVLAAWARSSRCDARLSIYGGPPPSGDAVDVRALVRDLGCVNVTIHGELDDIRPALDRADVVLVPSVRPDPLPTIAIEAAAAGRAVFASDTGGLPEIIDRDATGLLVPAGDVGSWARAIDSVSRGDIGRMGAAARVRYEATFSREAYVTGLQAEFRHFVPTPRPAAGTVVAAVQDPVAGGPGDNAV